jgi:hypothetical protein
MPIDAFPDDIETLRALVVAAFTERDAAIAERDGALSQIDRLRHLLRQLSRAHFGSARSASTESGGGNTSPSSIASSTHNRTTLAIVPS